MIASISMLDPTVCYILCEFLLCVVFRSLRQAKRAPAFFFFLRQLFVVAVLTSSWNKAGPPCYIHCKPCCIFIFSHNPPNNGAQRQYSLQKHILLLNFIFRYKTNLFSPPQSRQQRHAVYHMIWNGWHLPHRTSRLSFSFNTSQWADKEQANLLVFLSVLLSGATIQRMADLFTIFLRDVWQAATLQFSRKGIIINLFPQLQPLCILVHDRFQVNM